MKKTADDYRSEQDKKILAAPDSFLIRVYQQKHGWIDSVPFQAKEALERFNNIRAMDKPYRVAIVALKQWNGTIHVCSITVEQLADFVRM